MPALIAYHDGADGPRTSPFEVAAGLGIDDFEVFLGWTLEPHGWLDDPRLSGVTYMAGSELNRATNDGRLRYVPMRLSALPRYFADRRPEVAVVTAVPRGRGYALGSTVGWGPALVRSAQRLVVEVDRTGMDLGGPAIDAPFDAVIERPGGPTGASSRRDPDAVERVIGAAVAGLIPAGATIQFGPGGIGEAIVQSISRPVSVRGGIVSDAVADLAERELLVGMVTAPYAIGGEPIRRLYEQGRLQMLPIERSHDVTAVGAIPRYVACNAALQVSLDGSCNVETVGSRIVAGIGGHADFAFAASHSTGGLSVLALKATTRRGDSTIVPVVDRVSTPRSDIDVVVTEHGVADLRRVDDAERRARLIAIAAPEHRDRLSADPLIGAGVRQGRGGGRGRARR